MRTQRRESWSEWLTTVLAMLWLALFPLWQDGSYSRITRSKWIGMLMLTAVTVTACAYMLLTLARERKLRRALRLTWLHGAALAYFGLVALSAAFGSWADYNNDAGQLTVIYGAKRYEGLITQGCYGLIFLCLSLTRVKLRYVMDAAAITLLAYGGIVALQYQEINVLELFPAGTSIYTNYEFQGTIGNIDMVVGYVAIVMPLLLTGFARMEKPRGLWLCAGLTGILLLFLMEVQCGLVMLAVLLFALGLLALRAPRSRWRVTVILGGTLLLLSLRLLLGLPWLDGTETLVFPHALQWRKLLVAALGAGFIGIAPVVRKHPGRALPRMAVAAFGLAAVLAMLLALYVLPIPAGNGLWELQEILHGRAQDAYGSERIGIWRLTLEMSRRNLLWGTGPDTFLYAMDDYLWRTGQSLVQRFDNPHNLLLAVLSNSGLPAMGMFILLCAGAVAYGLKRAERDEAALPLTLAVLCYLAQGMFTFSICLVTPMFWAALGMLAATAPQERPPMDEYGKDDMDHESDPS